MLALRFVTEPGFHAVSLTRLRASGLEGAREAILRLQRTFTTLTIDSKFLTLDLCRHDFMQSCGDRQICPSTSNSSVCPRPGSTRGYDSRFRVSQHDATKAHGNLHTRFETAVLVEDSGRGAYTRGAAYLHCFELARRF